MAEKEIRTLACELRVGPALGGNSQGDEMVLVGRAITYGALSAPLGNFRERVQRGALAGSLADKTRNVIADWNHKDDALPLGTTQSGTLKLVDGPDGLDFRCVLDKNQEAHRALYSSCKRGDVATCSWAFNIDGTDGEDWDMAQDEEGRSFTRRTIKRAILHGISVVNHPAYPGSTTVAARSAELTLMLHEKQIGEQKIDAMLRAKAESQRASITGAGPGDAGFSRMEGDGQTQDPTQSLRCPGRTLTANRSDHVDASDKHRCLAQRCSVASRADLHYRASEAHKSAAAVSPDDESLYAETCGKAVVACQRAHDYQNMGAE